MGAIVATVMNFMEGFSKAPHFWRPEDVLAMYVPEYRYERPGQGPEEMEDLMRANAGMQG